MPHIRVLSGFQQGHVYPVTERKMIIGRDPKSDIPLAIDSPASRQHAALYSDDGGWRIQDLGSTNGTLLNDERLSDSPIAAGDRIVIGDASFLFENDAEETYSEQEEVAAVQDAEAAEPVALSPAPAPVRVPEQVRQNPAVQAIVTS